MTQGALFMSVCAYLSEPVTMSGRVPIHGDIEVLISNISIMLIVERAKRAFAWLFVLVHSSY